MPNIEFPFKTYEIKGQEHNSADLTQCSLYRLLPPQGKEYMKKSRHVLQYLHMIPVEKMGTPKFYSTLTREMKKIKNPNLIYPVNENIAVHICPDKEDARNYYIPIEPVLADNFDNLVKKVEKRIVSFVDQFEEPKNEEEKKVILEKCIDMVCETKGNGRNDRNNSGNSVNGIGKLKNLFLKFQFLNKSNSKLQVTPYELKAIKYLMIRDKVGTGILEPFLHDSYIEDISCSGLGQIFIEHKIFEALKSPISFENKEDLDTFVIKLSEKIGKPISYRNPIVDAVLPDGSRINIVFGEDISKRGSNFTIRKFSETPLSVLQLIEFGTLDYIMAAYLWLTLREGMNCFVAGETASGKTTTMNALTTFIPPNAKIVCTTYDSKIIVREGTIQKIGDFIKAQRTGEILSWDTKRPVFADIKSSFELKSPPNLIKITTHTGCILEVTPSTEIPVLNEDGIEDKPAAGIKSGDYIPQLTKVNVETDPQAQIPLIDVFKDTDIRINLERDFWNNLKKDYGCRYFSELADKLGVKYEHLKKWIQGRSVALKDVIKWHNIDKSYIPFPDCLSPELSYLVGLIFADGSLYNDKVTVELCHRYDEGLIGEIKGLTKFCFGIEAYKNCLYGKDMWNFFNIAFDVSPHKSHNMRVPEIIMRSPEKCISSFIAGFIDGDGCIDVRGRGIIIEISSRHFLEDFHYLLLRLGIFSTIQENSEMKGYKKKSSFILRISGAYLEKAIGMIGPEIRKEENREKIKQLQDVLSRRVKRLKISDDVLPSKAREFISKVLQRNSLLYAVYKEFGRKEEYNFYRAECQVNKSTILDIIEHFPALKRDKDYEKMERLAEAEDIRWVKVKKVEKIDSPEFVYDFCMKKSPWYLTGRNGFIVCHNSIEDTPELQVPHKNWIREVVRTAEGKKEPNDGAGVGMFDLLKAALRQRPNEIIVGEIRGIEGNIAFQGMQTGHSAMSTFHAASVEKLIQRLSGDPINVPKAYIDNLNLVIIQSAVRGKDGKTVRRITSVNEIVNYDPVEKSFSFVEVFRWNPISDTFEFTGNMNSYLLETKIAAKRRIPEHMKIKIYKELEKRARMLQKVHKAGVTNFYELFGVLSQLEKEGIAV